MFNFNLDWIRKKDPTLLVCFGDKPDPATYRKAVGDVNSYYNHGNGNVLRFDDEKQSVHILVRNVELRSEVVCMFWKTKFDLTSSMLHKVVGI